MDTRRMIDRIMVRGLWKGFVGNALALVSSSQQTPEGMMFLIVSPALAVSMFERPATMKVRKEPLLLFMTRAEFIRCARPWAKTPSSIATMDKYLPDSALGTITVFVERTTGFEWHTARIADIPMAMAANAGALRVGDDGKTVQETERARS